MERIQNLNQLFQYQLQDLYSAQTQFQNVLSDVRGDVSDGVFTGELENLWTRTRDQAAELERIAGSLEVDPRGNKCEAAEGLVRETREFLTENADSDVRDAGLIANLQRILHYQIAGFGTAATYARQLELDDVFIALNDMLERSRAFDAKLTELAKERINTEAMVG